MANLFFDFYEPQEYAVGNCLFQGIRARITKEEIYTTPYFEENITVAEKEILPLVTAFREQEKQGEKLVVDSYNIPAGEYIFNSKLGICQVIKVRKIDATKAELTLCKPGFARSGADGEYTFQYPFSKNVKIRL